MRAYVYALQIRKHREWRVTLDSRIDAAFWFEHYGAAARMFRLEQELSWGQALWLQQRLALVPTKALTRSRLRREIAKSLRQIGADEEIIRRILAAANGYVAWSGAGADKSAGLTHGSSMTIGLYRRNFTSDRLGCGGATSAECDFESTIDLDMEAQDTMSTFARPDRERLRRVFAPLAGRSLLPDEVHNMLSARMASEWPTYEWRSVLQTAWLYGFIELEQSVSCAPPRWLWQQGLRYSCRRCGSGSARLHWTPCPHCGGLCPYCEECLTMGRSRFCTPLVNGLQEDTNEVRLEEKVQRAVPSRERMLRPQQSPVMKIWRMLRAFSHRTVELLESDAALGQTTSRHPGPTPEPSDSEPQLQNPPGLEQRLQQMLDPEHRLQKWGLSPAQREAVRIGLCFLHDPDARGKRFLLWAVTGAGKTEMLFPLIEAELNRGGLVLVATPRRDVVLELKPRLAKAFPAYSLVTLYGGSTERWEQGEITLATTHQLLRFRRRFDLVIIDEVDAFPLQNSPMLQYAAWKAGKPEARVVLLSATPPQALQRQARWRRLAHAKVPVRFHRYPLPVPRLLAIKPIAALLRAGTLPPALREALQMTLARGAQAFVFVPRIKPIEPLVALLRRNFPGKRVEGTSSHDEGRGEKVLDLRGRTIDILVTTTILERGVTIPKADVYVLDADSALFDAAALVQMAGRAGRSAADPQGNVLFAAHQKTRAQLGALRQIRAMNRLARRKGYLQTGQAVPRETADELSHDASVTEDLGAIRTVERTESWVGNRPEEYGSNPVLKRPGRQFEAREEEGGRK